MKKALGVALASVVAFAVLGGVPAAFAGGSAAKAAPVVTNGTCSANSTWRLKLTHDSATKIEADLEVHTGVAGQAWKIRMKDNGILFARGSRTTQLDGSFDISRKATDQSGTDNVTARATNAVTGEVCKASASI